MKTILNTKNLMGPFTLWATLTTITTFELKDGSVIIFSKDVHRNYVIVGFKFNNMPEETFAVSRYKTRALYNFIIGLSLICYESADKKKTNWFQKFGRKLFLGD